VLWHFYTLSSYQSKYLPDTTNAATAVLTYHQPICLDHLKWCFVQQKAANGKTESFLYRWQWAHAMFNVTCFPHLSKHRTSFHEFCQYINLHQMHDQKKMCHDPQGWCWVSQDKNTFLPHKAKRSQLLVGEMHVTVSWHKLIEENLWIKKCWRLCIIPFST